MDEEVLAFMWLKKKMKKRFTLIYNWLKAAEQDYEKDCKTKGELNLLLAQAEVKRAWELSCQDSLNEKNPRANLFNWKLAGVGCLSLTLLVWGVFHFSLAQKQVPSPLKAPPIETPSKAGGNLLVLEIEEKNFLEVELAQKDQTVKKTDSREQVKHQVRPHPLPKQTKAATARPVATEKSSQPIQIDMVDLVQEAQRSLHQSGGAQY